MYSNIFDKLIGLPLFIGMTHDDISQIVGQTKFGFHKYTKGQIIVEDGQLCDSLHIITDGVLTATAHADDHGYTISEELPVPLTLQPDHLFGLRQRFSRSFSALRACHLLTLDKNEVLRLSEEHIIFHLNLLNLISAQSQRSQQQLWHIPAQTLEQRIIQFVAQRCLRMAGPKDVTIKMKRLAEELNDSRLDISHALNNLQDKGLLSLHRGGFHIPFFELALQK